MVTISGDTNTSVVIEHAWQHQHRMDWSALEVLDLQPAPLFNMHARVVAYTPPVWLHELRAWTSPYFISFIVDIIIISHLSVTPTLNTHAWTHAQYHYHYFVFVIVSSFPDNDTRIGIETLESKLIKNRLEKSEMPIAWKKYLLHSF